MSSTSSSFRCGSESGSCSPMSSPRSSASSLQHLPKNTAPVVIRNGHIIPQIRLTPPDTRPEKSIPIPEQDLGQDKLFVPLRTEEIGWEEGGLIWAAKRFYYPTVNLYGGDDDRVIGTYRGGPEGYRSIEITDPAFSIAGQISGNQDSSAKPSKKTSSSGGKSAMPRGPVTTAMQSAAPAPASAPAAEQEKDVQNKQEERPCVSTTPSSSSSRQGSFSTEEGFSSGGDTGVTTPTTSESPMDDVDMASQLDAALSKVQTLQKCEEADMDLDNEAKSMPKQTLAKRAGASAIASGEVDASRLAGPFKAQLSADMLDKTVRLSDSIPARHFQTFTGRSAAEVAPHPAIRQPSESVSVEHDGHELITEQEAGEYAAGWVYEQNMCAQLAGECSLSLPAVR